ncbi:MAG: hypothetical protein ACYTFY_15130 [Planctomycetota bacterium]
MCNKRIKSAVKADKYRSSLEKLKVISRQDSILQNILLRRVLKTAITPVETAKSINLTAKEVLFVSKYEG